MRPSAGRGQVMPCFMRDLSTICQANCPGEAAPGGEDRGREGGGGGEAYRDWQHVSREHTFTSKRSRQGGMPSVEEKGGGGGGGTIWGLATCPL